MLVCDVDGTLLDPSSQITPLTRAAVRAAVAAGCIVTLATGRRFRSAKPIADDLGLELPLLVQNGALIKDSLTGEILYHCHLPRDGAAVAVEYFWRSGAQPIVYENAFTGERLFTGPAERDNDLNRAYVTRNADLICRRALDALLPAEPPLEVAILDTAEQVAALAPALAHASFRTIATTNQNGSAFLEVLAPECSKAAALRELARHYGVPLEQTMAIGDNVNDLEVLTAAGIGVAMGNALPQVKAIAGHSTSSNSEDGVAEAIARFVLERPLAGVV